MKRKERFSGIKGPLESIKKQLITKTYRFFKSGMKKIT
jgi:hypothetical protein